MSALSRFVFVVVFLLATIGTSIASFGQSTDSNKTIQDVIALAAESDQRIAVYMHSADWDAPRHLWDALPKNQAIEQYMSQYMLVEADAKTEIGDQWARKYNVVGIFPSLALLDATGTQVSYIALQETDLVETLSFLLTTEMAQRSHAQIE